MADLKKPILDLIGGYYEQAPKTATYPYSVMRLHRLLEDDYKETYNLEITVWDKHDYYSRGEAKMDEIERILDGTHTLTDNTLFTAYINDRQNIEDSDKDMKRIQETFILHAYDRRRT